MVLEYAYSSTASRRSPRSIRTETKEPFASAIKGDVKSTLADGEHALIEMAMATDISTC